MFKWIGGLIDRIFAVAGALAFSQIPLFMQQYQLHLSGHVAELQMQVQAMRNSAALTGKSLEQYIMKFLNSSDLDFKNQGDLMRAMIQRYENLAEGYNALQNATAYAKPFLFIQYFDRDIAQATWPAFQMGFSFNLEGAAYVLMGIVFGLITYWILRKMFSAVIFRHKLATDSK
jgi:hypothetical protein